MGQKKNNDSFEEVFWSFSSGREAKKEVAGLVLEDIDRLVRDKEDIARVYGVGKNGHALLMITNVLPKESIGQAFKEALNYYEYAIPIGK